MTENISTSFNGSIKYDEIENHPSFISKFFARFVVPKPCTENDTSQNHLVLIHSNGISLVGLDKSHSACNKTIESINFNIGKNFYLLL